MRPSSIVVLALGVVLLGTMAWWWLAGSRHDAGRPAAGAPQAHDTAAVPSPAPAAPPTSAAERAPGDLPATTGQSIDVRVRVLDDATREPVAGAEVWWSDATVADLAKLSAEDIRRGQQDEEAFLQRHGRRTTSDAQGRAVIRPLGAYRLVARLDSRYGHVSGDAREPAAGDAKFPGELLLSIAQDQTLVVRTVDAQRQPVGSVTVNLASEQSAGRRIVQKLGTTDDAGVLECRHAQLLAGRDVPVVRTLLFTSVTGAESTEVPIDLQAVPKSPVELLVPACGTVELTLLGFDGEPWQHTVANVRVRIGQGMHDAVAFGPDGKAVFPGVLCGKRFVATGSPWFADRPFDGPVRSGERVAVTLKMDPGLRVLTGRLLRGDHAPIDGPASIRVAGPGGGMWNLERDPDGRFFVPLEPHLGDRPLIVVSASQPNGSLEAKVEPRGPFEPGLVDAGDVVLGESPVLVAGEVVFADDTMPRDRVWLALQRRDDGERGTWRTNGGRITIDAERRFEVRAPAGSARWRLTVRGDCAPVAPIEFKPGTTDVRVPIDPPSSVVATFLPDPVLQHVSVRLVAQRADEAVARRGETAELVAAGDRLRAEWLGLGAGAHRLVVECPGQDPILDLPFDVPKGGPATDPRLVDIDLRGRARVVRLLLAESDGSPFAGAADVVVRGRVEPGARWLGRRYEAGTTDGLELVLSQPADLLVVPIGRRGTVAPAVFADARIAVAPAPKLTVAWADAPALPDGVTAAVMWGIADWPANGPLVHLTHARGSVTGSSVLLGEGLPGKLLGGRATGVCCSVMPMRPRIQLRRAGRPSQGVDVTPAAIDPAKLGDGEVIELRADAASLAKALAVING